MLMALAAAFYLMSLAYSTPAFVPGSRIHSAIFHPEVVSPTMGVHSSMPQSICQGLKTAAAVLAVSAAAMSVRSAAKTQTHTKLCAFGDGVGSGSLAGYVDRSPAKVYAQGLLAAATKAKESVPVSKDLLRMKELFNDQDWWQTVYQTIHSDFRLNDMQKAEGAIKLIGKFESKAVPTWIRLLGKIHRIGELPNFTRQAVTSLYVTQQISPVLVETCDPLSADDKKSIMEKMKAKMDPGTEIKLIEKREPSLFGGFVIYWDFFDPEKLYQPRQEINLSLKKYLAKSSLDAGVPVVL